MTEQAELYPKTAKSLETRIRKIEKSTSVCQANKKSLLDFLTKLEADGTSIHQQLSYMTRIMPIAELLGNRKFKAVTKKQMEEIFAKWRNGKNYKQSSINKTVECLKGFFRWIYDSAARTLPQIV